MRAKNTGPIAKGALPERRMCFSSSPGRTLRRWRTFRNSKNVANDECREKPSKGVPLKGDSNGGFGKIAEDHGGERDCLAPQGGRDDRCGTRDAERKGGDRAGHEGGSGAG